MADLRDEVPSQYLTEIFSFVKKFSNDAGELVRQLVRNKPKTSIKSDKSFVTEVDFAVEDLLRQQIEISFPEHGIFGEERESLRLDADFRWIVDPIDGTQNLVAGLPTYGIVVGCHFKGRPIAGAIHHPALNLEYVGAYKQGCYENGRRIFNHWAKSEEPLQEIISLSTRACFKRMGREQVFDTIMKECHSTRVFYDIFATSRVIAGQASAVLEVGMRAWDIAATEILTEESGGKFIILETTDEDEKHRRYAVVAGHPEVVTMIQQRYWTRA